jgi:2-polyprenyl-6-methoxyphenol hydroxylase-like FAD-dependent oxidoreductase
MSNPSQSQVLIVGAGPIGLMLAICQSSFNLMAGSLNAGLLDKTIDLMRQAGWLQAKFVAKDLLIG